ncbi:MAG: minichromosome maintenance protein MCM [Thermoplasmatota archaeon]
MQQLTVQDATLSAKWDAFFQELQAQVDQVALDYPETRSLVVPFNDVQLRDPDLADYLLQRPSHALRVGNNVLAQMDVPVVGQKPRLNLRITGLPESARLLPRALRSEHLGKLLALEGLVKKVTEVRPMMLEAAFECKFCGNYLHVVQEEEFVQEPVQCDACEKTGPWKLREEESRYIDHQKVEIQESPEGLRGGEQPERLTIYLKDDLVHQVAPGDRVCLNGVLTTQARRQGQLKRTEFNKLLNGLSVEVQQQEFEEINLEPEDEELILQLSQDPMIYERLRASFAPTIQGMGEVKDALILSLFGGLAKHYKDGSRTRGDIHVMLVGDPGVAKSQLLRYLSKLAPRSVYTSGKASTAAGLTAAAVKDDFGEGQWTLEAGALVLADMGVVCIDELDKMSSQDQSSMHQAMEQQEISVAKAGISATLKSRCAVIGAANPKLGRFDEYESLHGQIDMPPALLSRFDLIFALTDKPNRDKDSDLASFILKTHQAGEVREHRAAHPTGRYSLEDEESMMARIEPDLEAEVFRKYVAYAKRNIVPVLTDEALEHLQQYYVDFRNQSGDSIPFTARQLEAFVRLTEASARVRLSQEATLEDAKRALHIVEFYMNSVGVDRETGNFDIDVIATGVSSSQHDRMRIVQTIVRELSDVSDEGMAREEEIVAEAARRGLAADAVKKSLEMGLRNGTFYQKRGHGTYAPMGP